MVRNCILVFSLVILIPATVGWGQQPPKPEAAKPAAEQEPDPPDVVAPVDPKTYKIGVEDILQWRVWREPELSGAGTVRPDGKITVALVGDVDAAGLTPEQLAARLKKEISNFVNSPEVMVYVQRVRSKKYYLSGKIGRHGEVPLVVPTTIVEAIMKAGGLAEFANKKKVLIIRGNQRLFFNYKDYLKGKNLDKNILLEPGDQVVVD